MVGVNERMTIQKVDFHTKLGNPDDGVVEYEKLIATNPDDSRYYALMAEYCSKIILVTKLFGHMKNS